MSNGKEAGEAGNQIPRLYKAEDFQQIPFPFAEEENPREEQSAQIEGYPADEETFFAGWEEAYQTQIAPGSHRCDCFTCKTQKEASKARALQNYKTAKWSQAQEEIGRAEKNAVKLARQTTEEKSPEFYQIISWYFEEKARAEKESYKKARYFEKAEACRETARNSLPFYKGNEPHISPLHSQGEPGP